jgi:hypothetical protein
VVVARQSQFVRNRMAMLVSLADLRRAGIAIRADEAVAIALKLIHDRRLLPPVAPAGPPSLNSVCIGDDGSVGCRGCDATPGVAEIAILLEELLPEGARGVPGALRYIVARALHDVDAPPFDSLAALSAALSRHEHGDRDATIRRLAARAGAAFAQSDRSDERRRGRSTPGDYRRLLREADEKLYRQQLALDTVTTAVDPAAPSRFFPASRRALGVALAILIGFLILVSAAALRTGSSAAAPPVSAPSGPAARASAERPHTEADRAVEPARRAANPAPRPRPRAQTRTVKHPSNKTSSSLFPKIRVVDDLRKP